MALPKFNDIPQYELVIPSSKKKVSYRPFLVKEQKVLLIALESRDEAQILNSIMNTIQSCITDPIDIRELSTFDVEYIFIQLRTKSAGESSDIGIACSNCEHSNKVTVNLQDIEIDLPEKLPSIKLNDKYTLMLKYPNYQELLNEVDLNDKSQVNQLYGLLTACLGSLNTDEERISFLDETKEEVESFLNQLTTNQFEQIMQFANNLPKLSHDVSFKCEECGTLNVRTLEGLADFFQSPFLMTA